MARHGSIGEFNAVVDWTAYTQRLEQYTSQPTMSRTRQSAGLSCSVCACGASTYKLIQSLVAPGKPTDWTFKELVELLKENFAPKPSVMVQRFRLNSRSRQQGESVAAFVAELQRLTEFCDFGGVLEDMLRDRLVCRIGDNRMQCRLLADAVDLQQQTGRVHAVTAARKDQSDGQSPGATSGQTACTCSRCGGDHRAAICRFKDANCRRCGKKERIARACRATRRGPGRRHQAHVLGIEEREPESEYSFFNLSSRDRGA